MLPHPAQASRPFGDRQQLSQHPQHAFDQRRGRRLVGNRQTTTANGRNADSIVAAHPASDSDGSAGSLPAWSPFRGDVSALTVVDLDAGGNRPTPMQAFYFKTGHHADQL